MQRLPVALSATALVVAVLGSTSLGEAAGRAALEVTPFAKRADYAKVAGTANNAKALGGRRAAAYARLDGNGKLPASMIPKTLGGTAGAVPAGPAGPKGDRGPKGDPGAKGDAGAPGLVSAYASALPTTGVYTPIDGSVMATLNLPAGRFFVIGRVLVGDTAHLGAAPSPVPKTFYASCSLRAGDDSDYNQVRGGWGLGSIVPATMMVLHESATPVPVMLEMLRSAAWSTASRGSRRPGRTRASPPFRSHRRSSSHRSRGPSPEEAPRAARPRPSSCPRAREPSPRSRQAAVSRRR